MPVRRGRGGLGTQLMILRARAQNDDLARGGGQQPGHVVGPEARTAVGGGGHHDALEALGGDRPAQSVAVGPPTLDARVHRDAERRRALLDRLLEREADGGLARQRRVQRAG